MLEEKGVEVTEAVLVKLSIPVPGAKHPQGDGGRLAGQHLEELTSLVDGHVDLRENLATVGRVPPIDPCNSLTRIGVGSTALKPMATTAAMRAVTTALRLELAAASDPAGCEAAEARRAKAYMAVLQQPDKRPLPLGEQVALLYAASEGLLDAAADRLSESQLHEMVVTLSAALRTNAAELLNKDPK